MNYKTLIAIKLICLLILVALCIAVYMKGKGLECSQCKVTFISTKQSLQEKLEVPLMDLYDKLNVGKCEVLWSDATGFYKGG